MVPTGRGKHLMLDETANGEKSTKTKNEKMNGDAKRREKLVIIRERKQGICSPVKEIEKLP